MTLAAMSALLLSGCGVADDPAAVITGKPDQARSVALTSAVKTAVSDIESTRTDKKIVLSNPIIEGFTTKVTPHGLGANYCIVVTDNTTGDSKAYTSVDAKTIEGNVCPKVVLDK